MKFLKSLALSLFGIILFLSLTVFGFAFMVKSTVLNPDFVTEHLDTLDLPALVGEAAKAETAPGQPDVNEILSGAITRLEPEIKARANIAINSVYDYLLGSKPEPELKATLRQTFLSDDFVASVLNGVEIAPFLAPAISEQLAQTIPIQVPDLDKYVLDTLTAAEPSLKQQVSAASGPLLDYLMGTSSTLNVSISLGDVITSLEGTLRQAFIDSPPPGFEVGGVPVTAIPREMRGAAFDQFYSVIAGSIPATFTLDESIIPPETRAEFERSIADAEEALREARQRVAQFQQIYALLIVVMALMALGTILLLRNVKGASRALGAPLLTYGVMGYAGGLVANYLISSGQVSLPRVTPALDPWIQQLALDVFKPLDTFSLVVLIVGAALLAVSFVYKRRAA